MIRMSKRFFIADIDKLDLSSPIRYERYYIDDNTRIQLKGTIYELEKLDDNNVRTSKSNISVDAFEELKRKSIKAIIRDSYLVNGYNGFSIKKYYCDYHGLNRLEIEFENAIEMETFIPEEWMGVEITNSPLAFDKFLSKLTKEEFLKEIAKYQ